MDGFFGLLPETVLDAVERLGVRATGRVLALNSLENRVHDVELEDGRRVVSKFYRPGRWERETILDEHRVLLALEEEGIAAAAPLRFPDGETLGRTDDGVWFAVFPRVVGRGPDSLEPPELRQLGQLLGRAHALMASLEIDHRPELSPATYGTRSLETLLDGGFIPSALEARYADIVDRLVAVSERLFDGVRARPIHADVHRGNLLRSAQAGWVLLDFDDLAVGPAVQDLWLLLPARAADCPAHVDALVEGYELFSPFDRATLGMIEALRALRYVRHAAWVAARWQDPSFPKTFPGWGSERYWSEQLADLHEQLELIA